MTSYDPALIEALDDLVGVLQDQARELERAIAHIEGSVGPLPESSQMPIIVSRLSEVHHRIRKIRAAQDAPSG